MDNMLYICGMCAFWIMFVDKLSSRSIPVTPVANRVAIQSPGARGHKVTEIQGSEHAAKTLIVVNCQHMPDINHNVLVHCETKLC